MSYKDRSLNLLIECPRCEEADKRSIGFNKCGLCECEFLVASNGGVYLAPNRQQSRLSGQDR